MLRLNLLLIILQLIFLYPLMAFSALTHRSSSCQSKCGDITVPYPFGMGNDSSCFKGTRFQLFCNNTYSPPMLFFRENGTIPILNISLNGTLRTTIWAAIQCFNKNGTNSPESYDLIITLKDGYRISNTQNRFTAIGCNTMAINGNSGNKGFESGCLSLCGDESNVMDECNGIGCCQTTIPPGVDHINVSLGSLYNTTMFWNFSPCSYAFFAEQSWFRFSKSDLMYFTKRMEFRFQNRTSAPVVLDWAVEKVTCREAQSRRNGDEEYACGKNTNCSDSSNGPGYLCHCKPGYDGNPYLENGCQDIDECAHPEKHSCVKKCTNTKGSYNCSCPAGYYGDGVNVTKGGSGCTYSKKPFLLTQLMIGISSGLLFLFIGGSWVYWGLQKRKLILLKEKFFQQNGGMFLQQQLSSRERSVEATKIFTSEELSKATNNYHESHILGRGGYGTVYKGILLDKKIVAIKKSKIIDKEQIEQFINEVLILSQINHRNVVKLLGCCLETEVPLLVYEYITNGTLYHHIHNEKHKFLLSWRIRLRIATETAGALAYLHSSASQPIIHRDIKSTNILLDDQYTAKVSDFGASRLVALDQTQLSTLVQGTMGYLDPEYLQTSLLTDKSDVYSFGVVLVELLTGKKVLCFEKPEEERNLAMFFVSSMKGNRLFEVLEEVVRDGDLDQIQEVANLAKRCLRLNGEERPSMKEVAMELEGLHVSAKHAWIEQNPEETDLLLGESPGSFNYSNVGYDSVSTQVRVSLNIGR